MHRKAVVLLMLLQKPRVVKMIGQTVLNPRRLIGLNKDFVDYCGKEIVTALSLMTTPRHYPRKDLLQYWLSVIVLVHCTQGKDRTGLVVALALHLAGVTDDAIIADYAKSQGGLDVQRALMVGEMAKTGLDPTFSDAPDEVMVQTLQYIREQYGSPKEYLTLNGF